MGFWHSELVESSWSTLQQLKNRYEFILVGGWAVYLYTKVCFTHSYRDRLVEIVEAAGREFEELGIRNLRRIKQIKRRILAEFSSRLNG